jgi:hypothetical protein
LEDGKQLGEVGRRVFFAGMPTECGEGQMWKRTQTLRRRLRLWLANI